MVFRMTLDGLHRAVTAAVILLVLAGMTVVSANAPPGRWAVVVLLAGVVFLAFAFAPCAVEIAGAELRVVRRLAPAVHVPLDTIRGVEAGPGLSLRLFGVGGLFGSYGLYRAKGVGTYRRYATRAGASVLLTRTSGMPIAVTPDDAAGFARELRARLGT